MIVASEHQSKAKARKKYRKSTGRASKEHEEAKKNSNFTPDIPKGLATH